MSCCVWPKFFSSLRVKAFMALLFITCPSASGVHRNFRQAWHGKVTCSVPFHGRHVQNRLSTQRLVTVARLSAGSPASAPRPSQPSQPSPPPPGREDEFADSNGDSLQAQSSKVATLERDPSFDTVLQELSAIQQDGPRNVAILGTRHTSYLHQQIIELLTYANVLVGNHVFTSGAGGTNAAVIRGALRAERPDLLTVVLPQSLYKQPRETQEHVSYDFWVFFFILILSCFCALFV